MKTTTLPGDVEASPCVFATVPLDLCGEAGLHPRSVCMERPEASGLLRYTDVHHDTVEILLPHCFHVDTLRHWVKLDLACLFEVTANVRICGVPIRCASIMSEKSTGRVLRLFTCCLSQ